MKTNDSALAKYEEKQAAIKKLLKQIEVGIEKSDRGRTEAVHWGHVGSLAHIEGQLQDIKDMLYQTGEYAN
ncbi:MAG: hypothetical protein KG029_20200 [Bacteroidetes bacterium]|nr:hypothetical protein [Bacteroidota bacterium]